MRTICLTAVLVLAIGSTSAFAQDLVIINGTQQTVIPRGGLSQKELDALYDQQAKENEKSRKEYLAQLQVRAHENNLAMQEQQRIALELGNRLLWYHTNYPTYYMDRQALWYYDGRWGFYYPSVGPEPYLGGWYGTPASPRLGVGGFPFVP